MDSQFIRNFSIIAHIDHGKSTLADRMLELTGTVEPRKMREQVLDSMELERERGITIKMTPVSMSYKLPSFAKASADAKALADKSEGKLYKLNLIDTPGHIDFSYEVSRALRAVEGAVLLVDATQGVQAQTLSVLAMARESGLVIIPVVNKIDSPNARIEETKEQIIKILGENIVKGDILETSGKTGQGVEELLRAIVERIPPPPLLRQGYGEQIHLQVNLRALVFDFQYSEHRGVIVHIRIVEGTVRSGDKLIFCAAEENFTASEVGIFSPDMKLAEELRSGEIGYIVTGVKKAGVVSVGDTITTVRDSALALPGYRVPAPVVWASLYPQNQNDFNFLRLSLTRLRLTDSSLSFEEEYSHVLGRGFRCGFLGMLHLEIVIERLKREFKIAPTVSTPSIRYEIEYKGGKREVVYTPARFPDHGSYEKVLEPLVYFKIITPPRYIGALMHIFHEHETELGATEALSAERITLNGKMPLRELMRGFFDEVKSATSGYASLSYESAESKEAEVVRLDVLIAEELAPAFSRVVAKRRVEEEAEKIVDKLRELLPRQMFVTKIQAKALGRIIASRTLPALRKDVTAKLYGGDVTRKMKLLEKQKKGKKKMLARGKVNIPPEVFLKVVRGV